MWYWGTDPPDSVTQQVVLYGACILIGVSGATLQVTSFAMVSDVISTTTVSHLSGVAILYSLDVFVTQPSLSTRPLVTYYPDCQR